MVQDCSLRPLFTVGKILISSPFMGHRCFVEFLLIFLQWIKINQLQVECYQPLIYAHERNTQSNQQFSASTQ